MVSSSPKSMLAEVDVERGEAAGQEGAVVANLEVGALGTDAGTGSRIVELVLTT